MTEYDYIIILNPTAQNEIGFDELSQKGFYVGGNVRMQAAVDIYKNPKIRIKKIIVVGGGIEKSNAAKKFEKVKAMRDFLNKNGIPLQDINCVISEPHTLGNFRAVWREYGGELDKKTVGILTNFYHMPRAMRIAQDPQFKWGVQFLPICAESVLTVTPSYNKTKDFLHLDIMSKEIKGIKDWEMGTYKDQEKPPAKWRSMIA